MVRYTTPLDDALASRGHVRVLRSLDELPEGFPASAREIARRAGLAHNRASEVLADLAAQGLADVQRVARSDLYQLNRQHALFAGVHELFAQEKSIGPGLERFLRRRLRALVDGIQEAYLFGSVARRESRLGSDIDLAVVVSRPHLATAERALLGLATEVRRRFGTDLSVHLSREPLSVRVKRPAGRALWRRIEAEGIQLLPAKHDEHA